MVGPVPYTKRPNYPHLSQGEAEIWDRYIAAFPDRFDEVWYDVELGTPRGFDPERPAPYQAHHAYLGGYKIDVLGRRGDTYTIIEVKRQATTKALGEIWLYEHLCKAYRDFAKSYQLEIVTDEEMPHIREVCLADGVMLTIIPHLGSQTASEIPSIAPATAPISEPSTKISIE